MHGKKTEEQARARPCFSSFQGTQRKPCGTLRDRRLEKPVERTRKTEIIAALVAMPAKDFETVLHPIFEEDENTLIGVGTILGAAAGAAQAALY